MEMNYCSGCGKAFGPDQLIQLGDALVCAQCKPLYVQRMREGVAVPMEMVYAGFWIRVGAKMIDGLIIGGAGILSFILIFLIGGRQNQHIAVMVLYVFVYGINILYVTFFIGKYGATLGKMACGLKVVRPDRERVSYGRAFARYFAEILSGIILYIGYIMVAFDKEKRALHDHICDTRVIKG